jgi:hypothetical protein
MSQVILEKPNNEKRRASLISYSDATRTNANCPFAFSRSEDLTNAYMIENNKAAVLKRLEHVIEKLKDARKEIIEAVLAALEMKEAGDEIANQILVAMVAQDDLRNVEIKLGQTQTKIIHEDIRKKNLIMTQDFGMVKHVPLEEWRREAEESLYLSRYE